MEDLILQMFASPVPFAILVRNDGVLAGTGMPRNVVLAFKNVVKLQFDVTPARGMSRMTANCPEVVDGALHVTVSFDTLVRLKLPLHLLSFVWDGTWHASEHNPPPPALPNKQPHPAPPSVPSPTHRGAGQGRPHLRLVEEEE